MTIASAVLKLVASLTTNILVVGGSYGGMAFVHILKQQLKEKNVTQRLKVTLVDPKAGFLNVLGVPRAIVDPEFAKTQYVPMEQYKLCRFDRLITDDEYVVNKVGPSVEPGVNEEIELTFIQGKITDLQEKAAKYKLNNSDNEENITFDFCIYAAGRNRTWPSSPDALNWESYLEEMVKFNSTVKNNQKIAVVGAGAVGIEIAGDIKTRHPDKEVMLIHPHATFPPEPLTDEFKQAVRDSLDRAKVKVMTGLRVKRELENHNLELTNGDIIEADFTYWCTAFHNNTGFLSGGLEKYVSPKNNIFVNNRLQLEIPDSNEPIKHIYCVGDLVELPIMKAAGWAMAMARIAAEGVVCSLTNTEPKEELPPKLVGMLLVCGNEDIVSEVAGKVELNNADFVEQYKSYRFEVGKPYLGLA